jgi:hypothetical protein
MPLIELTELECKVLWLLLDQQPKVQPPHPETDDAVCRVFDKVYRAYRGMEAA